MLVVAVLGLAANLGGFAWKKALLAPRRAFNLEGAYLEVLST